MTNAAGRNKTRAERLSMPLARDVVKDVAVEHGACIRPIQLRRTDLATGQTEPVLVPCGHTLASVCPSCAERAKNVLHRLPTLVRILAQASRDQQFELRRNVRRDLNHGPMLVAKDRGKRG